MIVDRMYICGLVDEVSLHCRFIHSPTPHHMRVKQITPSNSALGAFLPHLVQPHIIYTYNVKNDNITCDTVGL